MNLMLIFGTVFSEWILEQPCWMPGSDAVVATCNPFQLQLVWQNTTILHQIKFHFCKWKRGNIVNVSVAPAKSKCVYYMPCQKISLQRERESALFCLNSKWRLQAVLGALKQDFALGSFFPHSSQIKVYIYAPELKFNRNILSSFWFPIKTKRVQGSRMMETCMAILTLERFLIRIQPLCFSACDIFFFLNKFDSRLSCILDSRSGSHSDVYGRQRWPIIR